MAVSDFLPSLWRRRELPARREQQYDPFVVLRQEMNELFDNFFRGIEGTPTSFGLAGLPAFTPAVDITESDGKLTVSVELPGLTEKDVQLFVEDDSLTVTGEKNTEREEKGENFYRRERSYGQFRRVIALPAEVDTSKIEARFKDGVLVVEMPKRPELEAKGTKVPIKAG